MNPTESGRLPAIFIGHGSPMNALEENAYTQVWRQLAASMPKPKAILAVSAHWYTEGTAVTAMDAPRTIHDFRGFPQQLFDIRYPAPGDSALAARVRELLAPVEVRLDNEWGLDHGSWSILVKMYPDADVPVVQLSIDATRPPSYHLELGHVLAKLRDEGVLLMATGNVVHNLRLMRRDSDGYDWALRFNDEVRDCLLAGDVARLAAYAQWGEHARLSVPTAEHFLPLLYITGTLQAGESVRIATDGFVMGSISMLTAVVGEAGTA
ncbi:MAG TPA: 4,5-DOPA dioxygenase extradiol [Noviherbaspirillum sp.]|uniref:4,5-DOPA-extradiol-dioxygenase n=1 Tax=Noviherbaspirillum sp. TaxID=1926288 RepID=UPI002D35CB24|nr:4,5-DOPA dioxygenase extradiol [Noviherbaspirillum sp.]HYD96652.1 4,5-DOPA dioxygenase extradiol [Noviherbaspirillum sp.]